MEYMVWNPANETYIRLPSAPEHSQHHVDACVVVFEYDPKISHHFREVCYLALSHTSPICKLALLNFSSKVGEWVFSNDIVVIGSLPPYHSRTIPWRTVRSHGALHLMLLHSHVAQFDFVKETFHLIKLPRHEGDEMGSVVPACSCTLGVSNGSIYYARR